jgi:hypothetical protein
MRTRPISFTWRLLCFFLAAGAALAGPFTMFTSIDYPGAVRTAAYKVNNFNQVVGEYTDSSGGVHGYVYNYGTNTYTPLNEPSSTSTRAYGINDAGLVTGFFSQPLGAGTATHGFFYDPSDNSWDTFDYGLFKGDPVLLGNTNLYGVSADRVVGKYTTFPPGSVQTNFFCDDAGCYPLPMHPGGASTNLWSINNSGLVVGMWFEIAVSRTHGYVYDIIGGGWTDFDYPGAVNTIGQGINNLGSLAGAWNMGPATLNHGFAYVDGVFVPIDPPGAAGSAGFGINDNNVVVGLWTDAGGSTHGYIGQVVPEPATMGLAAFGLLALATLRRRPG